MKKLSAFVLAFSCILSLGGCGNTAVLNPAPIKSVVVEDSLILVQSNGELSKPYENFLWAKNWTDHGWMSADATSISFSFSELCNEIPQIT